MKRGCCLLLGTLSTYGVSNGQCLSYHRFCKLYKIEIDHCSLSLYFLEEKLRIGHQTTSKQVNYDM